MNTDQRAQHTSLRHRCVVWSPIGLDADPDLVSALVGRGMDVIACASKFDALAQVCIAKSPGTGGPARSLPATILVLSDAASLLGVREVVEMAGRYAPRAALWFFDASGSRRLRPLERADIEHLPSVEPQAPLAGFTNDELGTPPANSEADPPRLRLAGQGPIAEIKQGALPEGEQNLRHTGKSGGTRQQVSDEELRMLLAADLERGQN